MVVAAGVAVLFVRVLEVARDDVGDGGWSGASLAEVQVHDPCTFFSGFCLFLLVIVGGAGGGGAEGAFAGLIVADFAETFDFGLGGR